ncbi:sigma-70 family RNA polymerase sigma factor [Streptomyces sp. NPDC087428]|uniref:sigma-70 family RNA polymerase sigma factor n=1 Tax=Streptomyces sp. NPDC087428 TaxID=3365788 RepID=UPI0038062641
MTLLDLHAAPPLPAPATVVRTLYPLVSAEAGAEAAASATGAAVDPADLEQTVWLRLLERLPEQGPPTDAARWVRDTVRGEARRARRTARHERPYRDETAPDPAGCPERAFVGADERRVLRAAVDRLPARCARVLRAMLAPNDPTYREIAGELGMSQGSLGPIRSRCLGCLRRMLAAEVVAPELRGKER